MKQLSPYIRLAWDSWLESNWFLSRRVIFDYEIICIKSGELEFAMDDKTYHVRPGDIIFIRPNHSHFFRSVGSDPIHQPHIHFDMYEDDLSPKVYISFEDFPEILPEDRQLFREDIMDSLCPNFPTVIRTEKFEEIDILMMKIIDELERRRVYSGINAKGMFLQLLSVLLRAVNDAEGDKLCGKNSEIAVSVRQYLNQNLDRDVSLDDIAEHVHVSKYYLCRQFKWYYGVSPIQYHLETRINRAKRYLVGTSMSIGDIAERVGFHSIYAFSRTFKKYEKMSPSVYRKE